MRASAHDPEKLVLDLIGDGNRFSDQIMRKEDSVGPHDPTVTLNFKA